LIFILVLVEGWLDFQYFSNIDLLRPVSCCSALFGQLEGANPLPFGLDIGKLLMIFYLLYALLMASLLTNQRWVVLISSVLFVVVSYYAVVYFFGTYVYELPTHKCPFCMMQKEYGFVGYLIWGSLFIGTFIALVWSIMGLYTKSDMDGNKRISMALITIFVLVCSLYVAVYYLKNGVFL